MAKTNELFSVYLFDLVNKFCNKNLIVLPIKKILLMLWKVILVGELRHQFASPNQYKIEQQLSIILKFICKFTLGGVEDAFRMKNELRAAFNLPLITENPSRVINQMSPSNPPPNPIEIVNELQFSNPNVSYNKRKKVHKKSQNSNNTLKLFIHFFLIFFSCLLLAEQLNQAGQRY